MHCQHQVFVKVNSASKIRKHSVSKYFYRVSRVRKRNTLPHLNTTTLYIIMMQDNHNMW